MTPLRLVTTLGAILMVGAAQQRPMPVFRTGVDTVSIYATVRDDAGRLVPNLSADDFEIKDNGVVQQIGLFSREAVPITVVILVDVSGSQESNVVWAPTLPRLSSAS